MLTVGRREDGRKGIGLGFGGRMEENELEEGEACFGHEEETSSPEKDLTNLSYIDEKLHDVLGHFQKDFEGGVSAENLGAMFGGYGSFLPTYQRSPSVWAHPARSPVNASSRNSSKSPCSTALMGMRQNPAVLSVATANKTYLVEGSTAPSLDKSCKNDSQTNATISTDSIPQLDSVGTINNGIDQKTLKVRIKVGPESASARSKAAIYSGLGLDISPSSSPEDSPYVSEDHSADRRDAPDESPTTIIQKMTCFAVPGGFVLSPLQDSLLHLKEKNSSLKNVWTNIPNVVTQVTSAAFTDMPPSAKDGKNHMQKKMKSLEKSGRAIDLRSSSCKGDVSTILKRETDSEVLDGQVFPDVLNFTSCSVSRDIEEKEGRQGFGESLRGSNTYDLSLDPNKLSGEGRLSSSDTIKDNPWVLIESLGNAVVGTSGNEPTFFKGNLGSKTNLPEQVRGERGMSNLKDASVDIQKEGRGKPENFFDTARSDPNENMERKDLGVQYAEPANQNLAHKVNLYEQDEEMMFQARKQASEGKGKWKKSQTNGAPSLQSIKKNPKSSSSMKIKEKKNRPPSKGECANDKLKELKFRDEYGIIQYKESHVELGDITAELVEDRTKLLHAKDKMMGIKHENEYPLASDEKAKERPVVRMMDNAPISEAAVIASVVAPKALNNPALDAVVTPAPSAPVVIQENWVGCDKCQKWRLLPYGTNPGLLPKKWQCNMLNWLGPGMNKCSISEEETTKALHTLYQIPISQCNSNANGVNAVASNTVLAEGQFLNHTSGNNTTNLPANGKKKHKLKDPSNLVNGPALLQCSASVKKNQQVSVKSRSLNDVNVNWYQLESNMLSKTDLDHAKNPTDFAMDKQKHKDEVKPQILGRHSDGGDFVGNAGRPSKLKSKRDVDQDDFTTTKKLKKEELNYASEGWHSDYEGAGNLLSAKDNALPTDVSKHNMQNYNGFSSSKVEGILPTSSKRVQVQTQAFSNGKVKDHLNGSSLERSKPGSISKKRKNKVSQDTRGYLQGIHGDQHFMDSRVDAREAFSENELKREKKLKVLKPEVKDSSTRKADGRLENKGRPTKILFSGSRRHPTTYGMESDGFAVKEEHRQQFQVDAMPRQASEVMESLKKDSAYAQSSAAATSSSSKVSSSRKSRGNFQEARGSPVESVSSSPFRNSNSDKLLPSRRKFEQKDDGLDAGLSAIGSPKNYSDAELDAGSEPPERMKDNASSFQGRSLEGHRAAESRGLDSMRGKYDFKDNEANKLNEGKDKDGLHLTLFGDTHDDFSPTDFEGRNLVNAIVKHDKYEPLDKDHFRDSDKMNNSHLANGSMQRKSCKGSSHSKEKHSTKSGLDRSKIKVPGSVSKQVELLSAKNDPDSQDMVCSASHDNHCKDFKQGNGNCVYPVKDVEDVVKKESLVKLSFAGGRESHSDFGKQENSEPHGSGMFDKQLRDGNSRDAVSGAGDGKSMLQDITQRDPHADDKKLIVRSEMAPGRGKSQPVVSHRDKQETQSRGNQSIPTVKGGKSEICPIDAANGDLKVIKSRKPDEENGTHQVSLRQATPSRPDHRSPVRRDGQSAANVLKEARDLKHKANRLKSEGLELESTGLYFQAAMKFLYYASLLEPPHVESARHGEGTQSVKMYSETAQLCEFCAHEYERCKKMAAAALAYKCVEVAYMKVSYFKHSCASKDRHELQSALHMVVPGESPSSSASDVDNLNNQVSLDKSTSARGVSSPQVAGNHVVAARNRPNFVRLLNYANETVCAFDASRKMQLAFAAAGSGLDKDGNGRLSSVRKAIDFNFHDVERLLQLIRLSMESISC